MIGIQTDADTFTDRVVMVAWHQRKHLAAAVELSV